MFEQSIIMGITIGCVLAAIYELIDIVMEPRLKVLTRIVIGTLIVGVYMQKIGPHNTSFSVAMICSLVGAVIVANLLKEN